MRIFCKDPAIKKIYFKLFIMEIIIFILYIVVPKIIIATNKFFSEWKRTEIIDFISKNIKINKKFIQIIS